MRLRILNLSLLFLYKYDKNLTHASDYTLSDTKNNNNYLIVFHPFTESSLLTQQTKFTRLLCVYTEHEVKVEIVASSENLVF